MNIIGIHDSHDAGAALIKDKNIIAVNEERLNRKKLTDSFPNLALNKVLELGKIKAKEVDYIALNCKTDNFPKISPFLSHLKLNGHSPFWLSLRYMHEMNKKIATIRNKKIYLKVLKKKFPNAKIITDIQHHLAHAASAYYTSGWKNTIVMTMDAWGEDASSTIWEAKNGELQRIFSSPSIDSVGYMYSRVTAALGYRVGRHEGKITGLAARGKPNPRLINLFRKMIKVDKKNMKFTSTIDKNYIPLVSTESKSYLKRKLAKMSLSGFKKTLQKYEPQDIAFAVQFVLEEVGKKYVSALVDYFGKTNIALAGGVTANVCLNSAIHQVDGIKNIFVHPHMSDGGLGLGNALYVYNKKYKYFNEQLQNVYFGPEFEEKYIEKMLNSHNIKYKKYDYVEGAIAKLLANEEIVARFNGKMEYGPRALGNRSILYQATDPTVNDWLNQNLNRTEFMPFAPVTIKEDAKKCYKGMKGAEYAANFMVITFKCTDWLKENCPAVVHLDNTARPQIINKTSNPSYYNIIKEYKKLTGIPTIINTSFNMHEEPIVCSPEDAIRSFKNGNLKNLAIGNFIAKN